MNFRSDGTELKWRKHRLEMARHCIRNQQQSNCYPLITASKHCDFSFDRRNIPVLIKNKLGFPESMYVLISRILDSFVRKEIQ